MFFLFKIYIMWVDFVGWGQRRESRINLWKSRFLAHTLTCLILAPCRPIMNFTASWGTRISISMSSSPTNVSRSSAQIMAHQIRLRLTPKATTSPPLNLAVKETLIQEINWKSQPQWQRKVASEWQLEDPRRPEDEYYLWDTVQMLSVLVKHLALHSKAVGL